MTYLRNKPPHQWHWCGGKKSCISIIFWSALLVLVFFNKSQRVFQNIIVKTTMFLLPERAALKESINNLVFLEQAKALKSENQKLKEALGMQSNRRFIPARIKFGGGYLFVDSVFLDKGLDSGIKENSVVLAENDVLIGAVIEAGDNWSKVERAGSLGKKMTLVSADYNLSFEAIGLGGGEFMAEFPNGSAFKPGDILRSAENQDYVVGLVDRVDFKEGSPFGKILINSPISASAITWVKIMLNND